MFIRYLFNTTKSKEDLNNYTIKIANLKQNRPSDPRFTGSQTILLQADAAHVKFYRETKPFLGQLLSCIPFTSAFKARVHCAKCINNAYRQLRFIERIINEEQPPVPASPTRLRAKSDPLPLPQHFDSPLKPKIKDDSCLPNNVDKYCIFRRNLGYF